MTGIRLKRKPFLPDLSTSKTARSKSVRTVSASAIEKLADNGHWDFGEHYMRKAHYVGFLYLIINTINGKKYIGKKFYEGAGKKNRGKESNWRTYISSSKALSNDIKEFGKENFFFICLDEYKTRGGLGFAETWSLCFVEALSSDRWYNGLINKVSWAVKEPISSLHRERLEMFKTFGDNNESN